MAPAAKRRKTEASVARHPCFSCATDRMSRFFPDYNPSPDCEHLINTCKTCLKKWVEANIESASFKTTEENGVFGVRCPQPDCEGVMRNVNVNIALGKKGMPTYQRFVELERKYIGDNTPGWRWCLAPGCRAGQVHTSPSPVPLPRRRSKITNLFVEKKPEQEPDIFTCNDCGAKACVPCDRPYHEGETCEQYQVRTKDRFDEEDQALKTIHRVTKSCPGCGKRIEKNGGCPSMLCSQCRVNFCWNCEQVLTSQGCACRRRREGDASAGLTGNVMA